MANLKNWLDELDFDWASGRIIWQKVDGSPGWGEVTNAEQINADHDILMHEFDSGCGGPECPRIVAEDEQAIYFPSQYDGATGLEKIWKDMGKYLDYKNNITPYPGG